MNLYGSNNWDFTSMKIRMILTRLFRLDKLMQFKPMDMSTMVPLRELLLLLWLIDVG